MLSRLLVTSGLAAAGLALTLPAHAGGTLYVKKQGLFPAYAWVDGQPMGKVKKRKPLTLDVDAGAHEVWYAADPDGFVTLCHGIIEVPEGSSAHALYRDRGCEGIRPGWPNGPSAFRGAEVRFRMDASVDAWVSINGSQSMALPAMPFMLNLGPGTHSIVLYTDNFEESVFDQGQVTLRPGEMVSVSCTPAGCVGFDQPPVFIEELRQAPEIQLIVPGVSIDVNIGASVSGGAGGGMQMGVSVQEGGQTTGASVGVSAGGDAAGGGASIDMQVEDPEGGGASIRMDVEASETGGSVNVEVDED